MELSPLRRWLEIVTHDAYSRSFKQNSLQVTTIGMKPSTKIATAGGIELGMWKKIRGNGRWLITPSIWGTCKV